MRQLFFASACLTLPVFLLGMVFPMMPIMQPLFALQVAGFPLDEIVKWMLVTPVQFYIGWRFHKGAWQALWNRRWEASSRHALCVIWPEGSSAVCVVATCELQ